MAGIRTGIAIMGMAGFLVAGCSSSQDDATSGADSPVAQTVRTYFDATANRQFEEAAATSNPGSPARAYAEFFKNQALVGIPDSEVPSTVTTSASEATLTDPDGTTTSYGTFEFGPAGLLNTWTSTPGGPLAPRIDGTDIDVPLGLINVRILGQYQYGTGGLGIVVTVSNPTNEEVSLLTRSYVSPDGVQRSTEIQSGSTSGSVWLEPKATAYALIYAADSTPRGRLALASGTTDGRKIADKTIQLS